jgi:hypothetical protein
VTLRAERTLGQSEVEQLDDTLAVHLQVLGLQVAVNDPGLVCPRESFRRLRGDLVENVDAGSDAVAPPP